MVDELSAVGSAETVFTARALLRCPPSCDLDELRDVLEALAHDLRVDGSLAEPPEDA